MTTKLVCRLLDADGRLLGWCAHEAAIRGDGYLRASGVVSLEVDVDGLPKEVSIHWADVNVETRVPWPSGAVTKGAVLAIFQPYVPMLAAGQPPDRRLPPVTTKSAEIAVPVGTLGAVGYA